MNEIKKDIFGSIPKIGDIIIFNPPSYKGLVYGECIGFTNAGVPKVSGGHLDSWPMSYEINNKGFYSIKTNFAINNMNDPQKNISYKANLLLTINFDDMEFTSSINNYKLEVSGDYDYSQWELEDMVIRNFTEEHEDVFMDTDLEVVITSMKKF